MHEFDPHRFNPYDLNDVAEINRERHQRPLDPGKLNPYDLNDVAEINRVDRRPHAVRTQTRPHVRNPNRGLLKLP